MNNQDIGDSRLKQEFDMVVQSLITKVNSKASETIYSATEGIQQAARKIDTTSSSLSTTAQEIHNSIKTIHKIESDFQQDLKNFQLQQDKFQNKLNLIAQEYQKSTQIITIKLADISQQINQSNQRNKLLLSLILTFNLIGFGSLCFFLYKLYQL